MNTNSILTFFELTTIFLSIISFLFGVKELYAKSKKIAYHIKKSLLVIAGFTIISATCTWYFNTKLANQKETEYKNYKLATQNEISKNKEKTAYAILRSDSLKNELLKAKLNIESAKSEREKLIIKTWELKNENVKLSLKLKKEENKSNALINSIAPRTLEQYYFSNHLKKYKNIKIKLFCVLKEEPLSILGQLNVVFQMAGWKIIETRYLNPNSIIPENINIYRNVGPQLEGDNSDEAANALLSQFKFNNVKADLKPASDLPLNTLKIVIGKKSNDFIQKWTSKNIQLILKNKELLLKQLAGYNKNRYKEFISSYPLGIILFAIDKNDNIIPYENPEMNFLKTNWDYAKIEDNFGKKVLKLPSIIYRETGDEILDSFNEVSYTKKKYKVQLPRIGYKFRHILVFFEIFEINDKGTFCLIGFKKSKT